MTDENAREENDQTPLRDTENARNDTKSIDPRSDPPHLDENGVPLGDDQR